MPLLLTGALLPNQGRSNGNLTVLNPNISANGAIAESTLLCGKYRVVEKMSVATGEADLMYAVTIARNMLLRFIGVLLLSRPR